jgi:hypothetical protein
MKKILIISLITALLMLTGCDILGALTGGTSDHTQKFESELESSTGKWILEGDEDTYFTLDGSAGAMTFTYTEDGLDKYTGSYRVVYQGNGKDVTTPLTFILTVDGKEKEDWLSTYTEDFETDFSQFTLFAEEEDLGFTDGSVYTHIYRLDELPYKMGSYLLEGKDYKDESDDYMYANRYYVPSGTYELPGGESITFLTVKPSGRELFSYKNGDVTVLGTYTIAQDKKTIYLYIEHDPYSKVTSADKDKYDTTFNIYYPPDFYLRGDFSGSESIVIDGLYHHSNSPTKIPDSAFVFGTYTKTD